MGVCGPYGIPEGPLGVPEGLQRPQKLVELSLPQKRFSFNDAHCLTKLNRRNHVHRVSGVDYAVSKLQSWFAQLVSFIYPSVTAIVKYRPLPLGR